MAEILVIIMRSLVVVILVARVGKCIPIAYYMGKNYHSDFPRIPTIRNPKLWDVVERIILPLVSFLAI